MSHSIKDIEKWKKEYSLLKDIWTTYDAFDKDVENDTNRNKYISVCSYFIDPLNEEKEKHKEFCMKLVRNLGHYSGNYGFLTYRGNRCLNLNNWMYDSMMKYKIPKFIITKCFKEYNDHMKQIGRNPRCFDYSYDHVNEDTKNIIIFKIFESNIDIFKNILEDKIDLVHCSCQKFIKDVVSIYKYMKYKYCSNDLVMRNQNICQQLYIFEESYQFLYSHGAVGDKIPSLKYKNLVNLLGCESDNSLQGKESTETYNTQNDVQTHPEPKPVENPPPPQTDESNDSHNNMSPTVSTALGTVAGASSLLALLYKFTPGRNWIRSGIRGGRGRINSNLYARGPSELLFDGFEGEVMSSYNPTYNVGYGSA
ncbi:VIR protein [Plasmodium vivax]|uniref:VIR protein n=1 Tax=Plasmodium vivax TaxID=5855 RepID=A0A1G4EC02_PLAVI|nr:VIR protein [Plasmodium vivax]